MGHVRMRQLQFSYNTDTMLSICSQQNCKVKLLEEILYSYIHKIYFYLYANFSLITFQLNRANSILKPAV